MSKFGGSRNNKSVPGISSGSLSDIVFMLLFFFMVTTQMRETENKVIVKLPVASEAAKLERKDLSANINIGSHSPMTSISWAWISTAWPLPMEATSSPFTAREAPVVMRLKSSSSKSSAFATTWILLMVEPSLRAMNLTCLLPLFVLTRSRSAG